MSADERPGVPPVPDDPDVHPVPDDPDVPDDLSDDLSDDEPEDGADAAASGPLTPGGARLRNPAPPEPEGPPAAGAPRTSGLPTIPLKQYYAGVILMLVGIGIALYGFVDIYEGRGGDTGGLTLVSIAKVALGSALAMGGQRILRVATHDPRAGGRR